MSPLGRLLASKQVHDGHAETGFKASYLRKLKVGRDWKIRWCTIAAGPFQPQKRVSFCSGAHS